MDFCVTIMQYMVCLNGSYVGPIIPSRGQSQGDPLFPYLFLICVEGLSHSLNTKERSRRIHGCRISMSALAVTHLHFIDDSFLFFKVTVKESQTVKNLLNLYDINQVKLLTYNSPESFSVPI